MNKLRWGKFYWSDWSDDPALASCSLAAQGLWMRLLCIAAQGSPYGHVTINGKPPTLQQLGRLMRARWDYVGRLIAELERNGVADRDASGALVSRRLEHDYALSRTRSDSGYAGALKTNKILKRAKTGSDLPRQNSGFADHIQNPESESESPRSHPTAGAVGGGADASGDHHSSRQGSRANGTNPRANGTNPRRRDSRNAMVDIIREDMEAEYAEAADPRGRGAQVVPIVGRLNRREHDT